MHNFYISWFLYLWPDFGQIHDLYTASLGENVGMCPLSSTRVKKSTQFCGVFVISRISPVITRCHLLQGTPGNSMWGHVREWIVVFFSTSHDMMTLKTCIWYTTACLVKTHRLICSMTRGKWGKMPPRVRRPVPSSVKNSKVDVFFIVPV